MNKEEKFRELERIDLWINNADTKISYLLAFLGIIATIIFTSDNMIQKVKKCFDNILKLNEQDIVNILSLMLVITVMVLVIFIAKCIYHLLKASNAKVNITNINTNSTLFFGSIATSTIEEFKEQIKKQTEEELEDDIVEQIFINSKICNEKMKNYNKAIKYLKISLIILIIVIGITVVI